MYLWFTRSPVCSTKWMCHFIFGSAVCESCFKSSRTPYLMDGKWNQITVLICIFLISNEVSIKLYIFSDVYWPFSFSLLWFFCSWSSFGFVLKLNCWNFSYVTDTGPWLYAEQISFLSLCCLFLFLFFNKGTCRFK